MRAGYGFLVKRFGFRPFLPKARHFRHVCFVAKGSRQTAAASPFDAAHLRQTHRVNNSGEPV